MVPSADWNEEEWLVFFLPGRATFASGSGWRFQVRAVYLRYNLRLDCMDIISIF